jgi:hypothetical protein
LAFHASTTNFATATAAHVAAAADDDDGDATEEAVLQNCKLLFFHVHTAHLDIIKVFYPSTDALANCLKTLRTGDANLRF